MITCSSHYHPTTIGGGKGIAERGSVLLYCREN